MQLTIDGWLAEAIAEEAKTRGLNPDALVLDVLSREFLDHDPKFQPRDDWERRFFGAVKAWRTPLPPSAWTCEEMYD